MYELMPLIWTLSEAWYQIEGAGVMSAGRHACDVLPPTADSIGASDISEQILSDTV
jgi:hypothetical protein